MAATEHGAAHGVRAEPDVVSAKLVVGFAILLTITAVAAGAIVAALFWHFDRVAQRHDAQIVIESGLQRQASEVPPAPRLHPRPGRHRPNSLHPRVPVLQWPELRAAWGQL